MRVLVAESDDTTSRRIREALSADPRFEKITDAADGDTALARAADADVVVIDISIHGLGSIGTMAGIHRLHNPPAVVLIGSPRNQRSLDAGGPEGAADVLLWPADAESLADRVATVAGRG